MEEVYKTIDDYDNYEVSNMGNVRNKKTGLVLKLNTEKWGFEEAKENRNELEKLHFKAFQAFQNEMDRLEFEFQQAIK